MDSDVVYVVTSSAINLTIDGKMNVLHKSHQNYDKIVEMLKTGSIDKSKLQDLLNPAKKINEFGQGKLKVRDGSVIYVNDNDEIKVTVDDSLIKRIESMMDEGFSVAPLVAFFENLMLNPSARSVQGLYKFLEKNELPLTEDGHFLAYKKVKHDYKDIRTGTFDNSVGNVVQMLRNQVDDDHTHTCSTGLHFASFAYARDFYSNHDSDDRMIIVKINPADVVAFPDDYDSAKGRTWRYEVIGEVPNNKMEYLLKNFQGIQNIDELRNIIDTIRGIITQFAPKNEDGSTKDYKLNEAFSSAGLHKERIRSIIDAVASKYGIGTGIADKLDTDETSIYKLVNFVTKEVDFTQHSF